MNKLFFSQVREDPSTEINCVSKHNIKKCMIICSGGCSVLSLLQDDMKIDVIDNSIEQIYLLKLKLELIKLLKDKEKYLDFIEGRDITCFKEIKNEVSNECYQWWKNHYELLDKGINNCGAFEELFRELVKSDFDFDKLFDSGNLIKIFGKSAVIYSKTKAFSEYFRNVIMKKYDGDKTNMFYHQILFGKYNKKYLPKYFSNFDNIIKNNYVLTYFKQDTLSFLESTKSKHYELIQVSNLTDWYNENNREKLIKEIHRCLTDKGIIVARRLNGDYSLLKLLQKYFDKVQSNEDTSYFYSEVLVGFK